VLVEARMVVRPIANSKPFQRSPNVDCVCPEPKREVQIRVVSVLKV
jgi:hypothetical protein